MAELRKMKKLPLNKVQELLLLLWRFRHCVNIPADPYAVNKPKRNVQELYFATIKRGALLGTWTNGSNLKSERNKKQKEGDINVIETYYSNRPFRFT